MTDWLRQRRAYPISAAAEAHRRGLKIIALADNPLSPLARLAGTVFHLDGGSMHILRSITTFIALVPALASAVTLHIVNKQPLVAAY